MATMRDRKIFLRLFLCCTWITFIDGIELTSSISDYFNIDDVEVDVWHLRDTRVAIRNRQPLDCEKPEVYICEEPLETIPPEIGKTCNYRNVRYHEQVYRWVAGRGCLLYTPNFLFVAGVNPINLNSGCYYGESFAPCLEFAKSDGSCGCYPFDPGLEVVTTAVRDALIPSARGRWERCFHTASDCCSHYMNEEPNTTNNQCETTFDGWTCWTGVEGGRLATEVCSEFAYSNNGPTCQHFSSKQCFANGTWQLQTDYSTCSVTPRLLRRYRFYIGMLAFSIASCLPAVLIFFLYKRLRIKRVILHRNLLIAIIVRNIFVIVSRSEVYIDELTNTGDTVMSLNGVGCRILAFAERFAGNMVFACMLVEGIYLHRTIVTVFRRELQINLLYGIGFVIALVPTISWAAVMAVSNDHSCWVVYTVPNIQWILDAPRVFILLINTCLFIDVLRVLLTKIRNTENANQLNTAKAALFLMPLFGTQFLLTAFRPNTSDCSGEDIYYYVAYTVEGLQGFIVAMLYCYINKEVIVLIKATYKKTENAVVSRIRDSNYPRVSVLPSTDRMTCSTVLPSTQGDLPKEHYNPIGSKLHVAEITSIQATERLAEILDPIYETIHHNGTTNEGYDSLDRSDNDSGFIPNTESKVEEYYGFTNESSISIDCQDWIRCISSPSSSVYNNSLNDYETKYLEKKFPHHPKLTREIKPTLKSPIFFENNSVQESIEDLKKDSSSEKQSDTNDIDDECVDYKMLDEILQYIETNEVKTVKDSFNPNSLSPNRKDEDKIVFVNE